jgi:hypothetical protein
VDLSGITAGRHLIKLTAKNIFLPFGVKIDQVAPQTIMLNLLRRSEKRDADQLAPDG